MSSRLQGLKNAASINRGNLKNVVGVLFLLPIYAALTSIADIIDAIAGFPIAIMDAMSTGIGALINSLLENPAAILDASAAETIRSLTSGVWAQFGPLTWPLGTGVILLSGYLVSMYLEEDETSDIVPYSFTDIPFVGTEEEGEG